MNVWSLLFFVFIWGFQIMGIVYADENDFCYQNLCDEDKELLFDTKGKIKYSSEPHYPTSLEATLLAENSFRNDEHEGYVGCVALKFKIDGNGKATDIEELVSHPKNVFSRSSILTLKEFEFFSEGGRGVYIFNYSISK